MICSRLVDLHTLIRDTLITYRIITEQGYTQPWGIKLQMSMKTLKSMCVIKPT